MCRTSLDGAWADGVTLWGLLNVLNIDVAVVSSLGESGLQIISSDDASDKNNHDLTRIHMPLILHLRKARMLSSI